MISNYRLATRWICPRWSRGHLFVCRGVHVIWWTTCPSTRPLDCATFNFFLHTKALNKNNSMWLGKQIIRGIPFYISLLLQLCLYFGILDHYLFFFTWFFRESVHNLINQLLYDFIDHNFVYSRCLRFQRTIFVFLVWDWNYLESENDFFDMSRPYKLVPFLCLSPSCKSVIVSLPAQKLLTKCTSNTVFYISLKSHRIFLPD